MISLACVCILEKGGQKLHCLICLLYGCPSTPGQFAKEMTKVTTIAPPLALAVQTGKRRCCSSTLLYMPFYQMYSRAVETHDLSKLGRGLLSVRKATPIARLVVLYPWALWLSRCPASG